MKELAESPVLGKDKQATRSLLMFLAMRNGLRARCQGERSSHGSDECADR